MSNSTNPNNQKETDTIQTPGLGERDMELEILTQHTRAGGDSETKSCEVSKEKKRIIEKRVSENIQKKVKIKQKYAARQRKDESGTL